MTRRVLNTERDREQWFAFLRERPLPITVSSDDGRHRSVEQNRLQRLWCNEISEQLGDVSPEEVRGMTKLQIAVPILRAEDEEFCEAYDRAIKPLPYEIKLACMMEPIDFPVTRRMTVNQKKRFLDEMYRYWSEKGIIYLTPETPSGR